MRNIGKLATLQSIVVFLLGINITPAQAQQCSSVLGEGCELQLMFWGADINNGKPLGRGCRVSNAYCIWCNNGMVFTFTGAQPNPALCKDASVRTTSPTNTKPSDENSQTCNTIKSRCENVYGWNSVECGRMLASEAKLGNDCSKLWGRTPLTSSISPKGKGGFIPVEPTLSKDGGGYVPLGENVPSQSAAGESSAAGEPWDAVNNKPCGVAMTWRDDRGRLHAEAKNTCAKRLYWCMTWLNNREPMCASGVSANGTATSSCNPELLRCDGYSGYFKYW